MKTRIIFIMLILVFIPIIGVLNINNTFTFGNSVYCVTTAKHDVKMVVEKIARIALSNEDKITMKVNFQQDSNGHLNQKYNDAIDTSKRLNYTFTTGKGEYYKITVESKGNKAPAGTALFVTADIQNGGSEHKGTSTGEVMILSDSIAIGKDLIWNIGSCNTGNNGVLLRYRYTIIHPEIVDVNEGTNCTITYTITEQ